MTDHTPAPWGIEVTDGNLWVGPLRENGKVGDVVVSLPCDRFCTDEYQARQHAHARLFSAAPEMLSILQDAKANNMLVERPEWWGRVFEAIAKASQDPQS